MGCSRLPLLVFCIFCLCFFLYTAQARWHHHHTKHKHTHSQKPSGISQPPYSSPEYAHLSEPPSTPPEFSYLPEPPTLPPESANLTPTPSPEPASSPDDGSDYNSGVFDVRKFGAVGDGITDDTDAFKMAWETACQVDSAVILVPYGFTFMIQSTIFTGPCQCGLQFQVPCVNYPLQFTTFFSTS